MEKNLKIFQMKSKANYDSSTKYNSCFQKFYTMWVLSVDVGQEFKYCQIKRREGGGQFSLYAKF